MPVVPSRVQSIAWCLLELGGSWWDEDQVGGDNYEPNQAVQTVVVQLVGWLLCTGIRLDRW